ncbi:HNH endonuclease [Thioalkalivibrio sp. ALE19]|uniref:HNH endonuclease n=1 Tax=Thioalkalivibrio sp. ALE19 TaxID=1266909 RepID=UPI0004028F97|nr:HNH endonuclease [Thioalkalivibrio sp. ALE19]
MIAAHPPILRLDAGGLPVSWIHWQRAAELIFADRVLWSLGDAPLRIQGGLRGGQRSVLTIDPVIATREAHRNPAPDTPPLTNRLLFARDRHTCLYCGNRFPEHELTRDHIVPRCQGGEDVWTNTASSCKRCNGDRKGGRTPEQAGMSLIALPYAPSRAEALILSNRRILADQNEYLSALAPDRDDRWN